MNKFFTKIVGAALGLAMAIGVGAGIVNYSNKAVQTNAVNYGWQKVTSTSEFVNGTVLLITQSSYYLDASQAATGNCPVLANLTLSNNLPTLTPNTTCTFTVTTSGAGLKLCKSADTTKWLITGTDNNKARINTGTSGNLWTIESAASAGEFYLKSNTATARYLSRYNTQDFRSYEHHNTNANLVLYKLVETKLDQNLSTTPANGQAYVGESITVSSTATTSVTWSIVNDSYTTATGAQISNAGVVTVTGAGNVKVKADAGSTYNDATTVVIFNVRPAVTSVVLSTKTAEIGLGETFDYNAVDLAVSPSTAIQTVSWSVSANTVSNDYTFNSSGLKAGETEGTVTLRCESTTDSTKYDEIVVTISSGTVTFTFTNVSIDGFVGKGSDITFTYTNVLNKDVGDFDFLSSDDSIVEITGSIDAEDGSGSIHVDFSGEGDATISVSYNGGETLDTINVSAVFDTVKTVNWSASNIDVFSGVILSASIDSTWLVNYEMESGDVGNLTYGQYTLKLGESVLTLPHTWSGEDSGKTLSVEYGNVSSSSVSVTVTQTVSSIMKEAYASRSSNMTFTKACEGSGTGTGDISSNWTITSDAAESNYDATKGIHYGTGSLEVEYIQLVSDSFSSGTITEVIVNASGASGVSGSVSVTVGGNAFDTVKSFNQTAGNKTFTGTASAGQIVIRIYKDSPAVKAIYCKMVSVTCLVSSGETNIANNASHKAAQRVAVKYAKAFNTAMDTTAYCTTNMDTAWATCSSAYNTFKSEAAALGKTEEAWAKDLIKYAAAKYTEDSDSDYTYCIERMMETYKRCVKNHGKTAFMSELVSLSGANTVLLPFGIDSNSSMVLIIVITISSVALVGGFIFFKKRRLH